MDKKVRVAIIGVGNCASSLVQGIEFYKNAPEDELIPGLMHTNLGGYHAGDIEFVAAVDVDKAKVGRDLSEAIYAEPNNTYRFCDVPIADVRVMKGEVLDGIGKYLSEVIEISDEPEVDLVRLLRETRTDVVVSYLPVGSEQATRNYAEKALEAGVGFVNCIPVFIAKDKDWAERFLKRGVPIIGDDIKSQVGATIVHRMLAKLFRDRGVKLMRTSQLNVGGFLSGADVVDLPGNTPIHHCQEGAAVVLHIQPIPYVKAIAIERQPLIFQGIGDEKRDQLFWKLVGAVVVA